MTKVYQFHLELRDSKPKIWRTIRVDRKMTVADFCYIVLVVFEMKASHLFKVIVPVGLMQIEKYKRLMGEAYDEEAFLSEHPELPTIRYRYELLNIIDDFPHRGNDLVYNVTKSKLTHAIDEVGERMELWYDFGDDWFVDINLTDIVDTLEDNLSPKVMDRNGYGIIEDCGGPYLLNEIMKAFKTKKSSFYKSIAQWLGSDDFNFSKFDIDEMNRRLRVIPQIFKRSYEEKKEPTQEEVNYIERK